MAIPDFQSIMLPLLKVASDGRVRSSAELREQLAAQFRLTDEEQAELLPSRRAPLFANRVACACFYLQKAGLLQRPKRGHYEITQQGREVLKDPPLRVDIKFLQRFPEFTEFQTKSKAKEETEKGEEKSETPEEPLEGAYEQLRAQLTQELLVEVKGCSAHFFERLVVDLLVKMGYGGSRQDAGQAVGKVGDEGIDGMIKEDRLGLDVIYLQAKKWEGTIGRPEIQKFVGALHGKHAKKGVFITTGSFARSAREYAAGIDSKVVLIDGEELAKLMVSGCGVWPGRRKIKKIDTDYFTEE